MLNSDYKDMLSILNEEKVKFILVGAYAMAVYGYPRATADIDIWVIADAKNSVAVLKSLKRFGAPVKDIQSEDLNKDNMIFQIGVAPRRIDIITSIDGLNFKDAYKRASSVKLDGLKIRVLAKGDIITNKLASGRLKDLADVQILRKKKLSSIV